MSSSRHSLRTMTRLAGYAAAAGIGAAVVFGVLGRVALGFSPWAVFEILVAPFSGLGSGSIGGRPLVFSGLTAIALGMLLHAGSVLISGLTVWWRQRLSARGAVTISISLLLIIWLGYFVNRPDNGWILWSALFLYSFLLSDWFAWLCWPSRGGEGRAGLRWTWLGRRSWRGWAVTGLLVFLVAPLIVEANRDALREIAATVSGARGPARKWSGVWVRPDIASMLEDKVKFLAEQNTDDLVYFTAMTFSVPQLSGLYPRLPVQDPYVETMLKTDYERMTDAVKQMHPARMFFEPEGSPLFFCAQQARLFGRLKKELAAGYEYGGLAHGWEVWRRPEVGVPASPGPGVHKPCVLRRRG
jgi:hypothetical protein